MEEKEQVVLLGLGKVPGQGTIVKIKCGKTKEACVWFEKRVISRTYANMCSICRVCLSLLVPFFQC